MFKQPGCFVRRSNYERRGGSNVSSVTTGGDAVLAQLEHPPHPDDFRMPERSTPTPRRSNMPAAATISNPTMISCQFTAETHAVARN